MKQFYNIAIFVMIISIIGAVDYVDEFYDINKAYTLPPVPKQAKIPHCVQQLDNSCEFCEENYFLLQADGIDILICSQKIDGCKYQSELGVCEVCQEGYGVRLFSNKRTVEACLNTIDNCEIYNSYSDCYSCKDGFYLKENKCIAHTDSKRKACQEFDYADICIRPHIYFAFDSNYNLIDNKRTMCRQYNKDQQCESCHVGYELDAQNCKLYIPDNINTFMPFNWLYVSLNKQISNIKCFIMYNTMPKITTLVKPNGDMKGLYGCFLKTYDLGLQGTGLSDICEISYLQFIEKDIVCIQCKQIQSKEQSYKLKENKPSSIENTEGCLYFIEDVCQRCRPKYNFTPQKTCEAITECVGYFDGQNCFQIIDNCKIYSSEGNCNLCEQEYIVSTDGKSCIKVESTDLNNCFDFQYIREKAGLVDNKKDIPLCYKCKPQFSLNSDQICEPVSKSNGIDPIICNQEYYQKNVVDENKLNTCATIQNCSYVVTDNNTAKCLRCDLGFKLCTGESCTAQCEDKTDNCLVYDNKYLNCTKCKQTYILQANKCVLQIVNCLEQEEKDGKQVCKTCNQFYELDEAKTACNLHDSKTKNSIEKCQKWDSKYNCLECTSIKLELKEGVCKAIAEDNCGFNLQGKCLVCKQDKYYDIENGKCVEKPNCATDCDSKKCSGLLYGFKSTTCVNSVGQVPFCLKYSQADLKSPLVCDSCRDGYLLTSDKKQCLKTINNCAALTNDSNIFTQLCQTCNTQYTISKDKLVCNKQDNNTNSSMINFTSNLILIAMVLLFSLI